MYSFLQSDLTALILKREALAQEIARCGQEIGDANQQSSETWHDNAPMDVAQRQFEQLHVRYRDINNVIRKAVVVKPDKDAKKVCVGSEVVFADQDGVERSVKIGSYTPSEDSDAISYVAPIAKVLMGAEVDDIVEGTVVGREVEYVIVRITYWT